MSACVGQERRGRGEGQAVTALDLAPHDGAARQAARAAWNGALSRGIGLEIDVARRVAETRRRARRAISRIASSRLGGAPRSAASRAAVPSSTPRSSIASSTSSSEACAPGTRRAGRARAAPPRPAATSPRAPACARPPGPGDCISNSRVPAGSRRQDPLAQRDLRADRLRPPAAGFRDSAPHIGPPVGLSMHAPPRRARLDAAEGKEMDGLDWPVG